MYNPLAKSYAIVTTDEGAHLFIDRAKIPEWSGSSPLEGVTLHAYEDISAVLTEMGKAGAKFSVDKGQLSWSLCDAISNSGSTASTELSDLPSPVSLLKSIKNSTELNGFREAHYRDGAALTAFLCWLDTTVKAETKISEYEAANKLEEFRKRMPNWVSPSFATISGYGPNGSV